jgi:hypothetical protein
VLVGRPLVALSHGAVIVGVALSYRYCIGYSGTPQAPGPRFRLLARAVSAVADDALLATGTP